MTGQRVPGVLGSDSSTTGAIDDGSLSSKSSKFFPPGPLGGDDNGAVPLDVTRTIKDVVKDWVPPAPTKTDIIINGKTLEDAAKELNKREEWGQGGGRLLNDAVGVGVSPDVTVKLHANLVLRMPKWTGYEKASPAAKAQWDQMVAKLKVHEDRHVAIAIEEANNLASALVGHEINDLAQMVTDANKTMNDRQIELDTITEHGSKEHVPFGDVILDTSVE